MLRLIHNQLATVPGAILVDDIDDGLPNKTAHRMGSTADPKAYERDGYANKPKQSAYIPRTKLYPVKDPLIKGYIDLNQTERVTFSAGKGKIAKLTQAGMITVVNFVASDLAAPAITGAVINVGVDLTITGTKLLSLTPNYTTVYLRGGVTINVTDADIIAGGGTIADLQYVLPIGLIGAMAAGDTVQVKADDQLSNIQISV